MTLDDIFRGILSPAKWRQLGDYLRGQRINAGRGIKVTRDRNGIMISAKSDGREKPPARIFWPTLHIDDSGETPSYSVTVSDGRVNERDLKAIAATDAMPTQFDCPSRMDGDDPHAFPIAGGESVFVLVRETETGSIGATGPDVPVDIVIAASDTDSLNYIPGVQGGEYYYRIANFTVTDDVPELEMILAGSHIYHTSGLTCDVRIMTCDPDNDDETTGEGYAPAQLLRLSIVSGRVVSVGESVASRALAPTVEECNVVHCT